jgi:hypothetical protein
MAKAREKSEKMPPPLQEYEYLAIIRNACEASPRKRQSEKQLAKVMRWASKTAVENAMLNLVLSGDYGMYVDEDSGKMTIRRIDDGESSEQVRERMENGA